MFCATNIYKDLHIDGVFIKIIFLLLYTTQIHFRWTQTGAFNPNQCSNGNKILVNPERFHTVYLAKI